MLKDKYLKYSILIYIIIAVSIWLIKPTFIFKKKKIKPFGLGKNKTIFNLSIILIIIAIIIVIINYKLFKPKNLISQMLEV